MILSPALKTKLSVLLPPVKLPKPLKVSAELFRLPALRPLIVQVFIVLGPIKVLLLPELVSVPMKVVIFEKVPSMAVAVSACKFTETAAV